VRPANFKIYSNYPEVRLIIQDVGPWDQYITITNDAERVVETLVSQGHLLPGRKLYYIDSENMLTEILVEDGKFRAFGESFDLDLKGLPR